MTRALGEVGEPIAKKYRPKKAPVPLKQRNDERQSRLEERSAWSYGRRARGREGAAG